MKFTLNDYPKQGDEFYIVETTKPVHVRVLHVEGEDSDWFRTLRLEIEREGKWYATEKHTHTWAGQSEVSRNPLFIDIRNLYGSHPAIRLRRSANPRTRNVSAMQPHVWSWRAWATLAEAQADIALRKARIARDVHSRMEDAMQKAADTEQQWVDSRAEARRFAQEAGLDIEKLDAQVASEKEEE